MNMRSIKRPMSQMRKFEAKEALFRQRKRILKYLVHGFLKQEGYLASAEAFRSEAALTNEYELCDNMDLEIILQDFCSYYMMRFNKQPQFCRQVAEPRPLLPTRPPTRAARPPPPEPEVNEDPDLPATFTVTKLFKDIPPEDLNSISAIERKPLSGFVANMSLDKKQLVDMLYQDIIRPSGVSWDDVKGLEEAKRILIESVVYPVRHPAVFTGLLEPWRGALLHGPPGAGKTLLARALAAESRCTFFNVACSTLVNKWRGESEKIVQVLFEMAFYYSPSIIFMDEVETLMSERSGPGEHEASRRLKSQLLTELDGVRDRDGLVFLLANSNMPWEIDTAMLRRLEKRIYIPLPDEKARAALFETYLNVRTVEVYPKVNFQELAAKTEGYSGSEIKLVCKEALMANVRKMLPNMVARSQSGRKERLDVSDILAAIDKTKPVSKDLAKRHIEWQEKMGCS
ncbi:PREDICTED: katanin p60 ATPase-containing subunit A-like 2 isoform X1 [Papilio xuthus]|uniref:Katanin p60 ATPase-containing subunit A-like 2 isoform X1 n=1 Tax=Papilio xuthus TaxID=66420 RepID=A0AAJ6ZJH3_PAPXU|nr:PREDICTED: katanin p60 ATPase-containing subunit A-like 2 isoform X1 [Papilio xuthus]